MKVVDLSGQRFGHLVAIRRIESHRTYAGTLITMWLVKCDCGSEKPSSFSNLKTGRVLTCGRSCPLHASTPNAGKGSADAGARQIWGWYRNKAKQKKRAFDLSVDDVIRLSSSPCVYCGCPPSNIARNDSIYGRMAYSGIDRCDNSQGYTLINSLPCCGTCNSMKKTMSQDEFFAHLRKILAYSVPARC